MAQHDRASKSGFFLGRVQEDLRSLNSSILIITQKMKYVVRNEKILGRNLIVLNKKLKALEERVASGQVGVASSVEGGQAQDLLARLDETSRKVAELEASLQLLSDNAASKEEVHEMHYVVDSINPLKFVTLEQAKDLLSGRGPGPRKARKKKK